MRKVFYAILAIVLIAMFFSNTSETEFLYKIDNSKDPQSKHYMLRVYKNARAINKNRAEYFSPMFNLDYINFGLFSLASIEAGWMGTLRIDGEPLGEYVNKISKYEFILIFGSEYVINKTP